jgi:hypothetical protein
MARALSPEEHEEALRLFRKNPSVRWVAKNMKRSRTAVAAVVATVADEEIEATPAQREEQRRRLDLGGVKAMRALLHLRVLDGEKGYPFGGYAKQCERWGNTKTVEPVLSEAHVEDLAAHTSDDDEAAVMRETRTEPAFNLCVDVLALFAHEVDSGVLRDLEGISDARDGYAGILKAWRSRPRRTVLAKPKPAEKPAHPVVMQEDAEVDHDVEVEVPALIGMRRGED